MDTSKEYIQSLFCRTDAVGMHAIGRALVVLYNRQTADEKLRETTRVHNNRGFSSADAFMGTKMAQFYKRNNFLSVKQASYWTKKNVRGTMRIAKYWKQLQEHAREKDSS